MVSRNFIASKYCYGTELKRALARHTKGTARVIPIILRPCDWNHSDVPFSKLNVLPTHAKAITSWTDHEEAFTIVAQRIREIVDQLRAKKLTGQQTEQEKQLRIQKEAEEKAEQQRIQLEQQAEAQKRQQQEAEKEAKTATYYQENLSNGVILDIVSIPGGSFTMGAPESEQGSRSNERPQHQVTIKPFLMGKYPVTQKQWSVVASFPQVKRELNPNPSEFTGDDRRPVELVNWYDAIEFCARLSRKTQRKYRLPSEAEWEYACRAGTTTPFYFGAAIVPNLVNYDGNYTYGDAPKGEYRQKTTPVGSFLPNQFGLYDMHGNVWEWCADHWYGDYVGAPTDGSAWISGRDDSNRMLRGGSWYNVPLYCRSTHRNHYDPDSASGNVGFRVVCSASRTS